MPRQNLKYIFQAFYFLVTSLIIIGPALYNRYALFYFDSGAYIEMAAHLEPSFHRAFGYPLMLKYTGMMASTWPLIFIQGLVLSVLTYKLIRAVCTSENVYWYHFLTVVVLSFTTSMSWYAAQLMPDVWTLILLLTIGLLAIERHLSIAWVIGLGVLLYLSLLTHLSHIPLLLLIMLALIGITLGSRRKLLNLQSKMWLTLLLPLIFSFLTICSMNAAFGHGFRLSLASNVFITANLGEMGVLQMYLKENCPGLDTDLCALKDDTPYDTGDYLWNPEGPVSKHEGGWKGANEEYGPIVHDFLTNPRYMKWFVYAAMKATVKQMFQIELGSGLQYAYKKGSPPYEPMRKHFEQEFNEYRSSVQNKGDELPISFFRILNYMSLTLSLLIIARVVLLRQLSLELATLLMVFVLGYMFNAAITGVLANVYERLQCRLLPALQFLAILVLLVTEDRKKRATAD